MKPCNFPRRKLRRIALVKFRANLPLTETEAAALREPKNIRSRRLKVETRG